MIFSLVRDSVFPVFCLGCDKREGDWLCAECRLGLIPARPACPECRLETPGGSACAGCARVARLERVASLFFYERGGATEAIIRAWKYDYARGCESALIGLFNSQVKKIAPPAGDVIVPVPLHPRRMAERGFNQGEVVGAWLGQATDVPVASSLRRVRYTRQQARLDRAGRAENVREAFALSRGADVRGARVILADDMYTTGSTMRECARVLLAASAASVAGFTFARG